MDTIEMNIEESTNAYGRHIRNHVIIYLQTQYRAWKDEELLITHITKTIAHEELHIILRRIGIGYTTNEEEVFKRLQQYLYPELYIKTYEGIVRKEQLEKRDSKTLSVLDIKYDRNEKALKDIRNILERWSSVEECLQSKIQIHNILKLRGF